MLRFSKKLKALKPLIRNFGRENLGNLTVKTREAYAILCEKQQETMPNPTDITKASESEAFDRGSRVAELEKDYLNKSQSCSS